MSARYGGRWCGEGDVYCGTVDAQDTANNRKDLYISSCLVLKYYPESGLDQHQLVNWEMILIHGLKLNLTTPWLLTPPISLGRCIKRMSMAIVSLIAMSRILIFWQASLKVRDWSQGRLDQSKDKHIDPIDILNLMYVWNKNLYL